MQIVTAYVITAIVFFGLDLIGLRLIIRPVFARHINELLLDGYRAVPAIIFYLFYIAGLMVFVSGPALKAGAPMQAALMGAFFGALAYGTYEFTNYATLKAWTPSMVAVDVVWGTFLTGFSAWAGVAATRAIWSG
ncbi:putative membrane protein [Rhodovulum iodosum]|uniref:Membrane protein n=1 Tax=Rhodovulum iodosum TaxID=68291 RepID=A0ABV3XPI0_9RHOB|nr:DUF2177 family protein [Rhodovulum robiginosum]RSK31476.1 DUF2177 family protein [Rhodovulum robiginosum]